MASLLDVATLRTKILTLDDAQFIVREVGALEFAEYGMALRSEANKFRAVAGLIAACIVDEDGAPLYTTDQCMVVAKSARVAMPIVNAIMELSGFRESPDSGESDAD